VGSAVPGIIQQKQKGDYSLLSSAKVEKRGSNTSIHLLPLHALIAHIRTTLPFFLGGGKMEVKGQLNILAALSSRKYALAPSGQEPG
jgi:hypothetical protein